VEKPNPLHRGWKREVVDRLVIQKISTLLAIWAKSEVSWVLFIYNSEPIALITSCFIKPSFQCKEDILFFNIDFFFS